MENENQNEDETQLPSSIDIGRVKAIVEAALLVAEGPLTIEAMVKLFKRGEITRDEARQLVREAIEALELDTNDPDRERGVELKKVASGYRLQVRQELSPWISRLWDEKPPRYSRALLETLALVAYRQPATRGDIEQVRGVAVSQNIMRTLVERGWIKEVGQREVPGRPSLYGTTKAFLDYFNLKSLKELPPLEEIKALVEPMVVEETLPPNSDDAEAQADPDTKLEVKLEIGSESADEAEVAATVVAEPQIDLAATESDAPLSESSQTDEVAAAAPDADTKQPADVPAEPHTAQIVPLKRNPS